MESLSIAEETEDLFRMITQIQREPIRLASEHRIKVVIKDNSLAMECWMIPNQTLELCLLAQQQSGEDEDFGLQLLFGEL